MGQNCLMNQKGNTSANKDVHHGRRMCTKIGGARESVHMKRAPTIHYKESKVFFASFM